MLFNLPEPVTKLDNTLIPDGFSGTVSDVRLLKAHLTREIDELGALSAKAQGLNKIITTAEKLIHSEHILYLAVNKSGNNCEIDGFLKVGKKKLYLQDPHNKTVQIEPMCILDFYVLDQKQRLGVGKKIFDYMLKDLNESPECLAIDGPSPKLISFMKKHYNINNLYRQSNNFAVSPEFFQYYAQGIGRSPLSDAVTKSAMPSPSGRYTASRPSCAIGYIIHGHPPVSQKAEDNRSSLQTSLTKFSR